MDYDIVLLPDRDIAQKAVAASQSLLKFGGLFALDDGSYFPHVSLYMLRMRSDRLGTAQWILDRIATQTQAMELHACGYHQSWGYIDVEYRKTEALTLLQDATLVAMNPLRDGIPDKDQARMDKAEGQERHNFELYGYKYVGALFRPHLTLTRFNEDQAEAEAALPRVSEFHGLFSAIGIFELGEHDTCVRRVAVAQLYAD